jgi:hypothetical protein
MSDDLSNLANRRENWRTALQQISSQQQHDWTLDRMTKEQAEAAIADAWALAQEFRNLADAIELQAEQIGEWMEDAQ